MTGAKKEHFKHSFQPACIPAHKTPPGARHKNNLAFRSRAPLSPCCKPFDLQSQKQAHITSGLMGLGWEQAQALEKDRSPAANPSISAARSTDPEPETSALETLVSAQHISSNSQTQKVTQARISIYKNILTKKEQAQARLRQRVQRRSKPLKKKLAFISSTASSHFFQVHQFPSPPSPT